MDIKEKRKILKGYIPMVKFISELTGKSCEVVLRDVHEGESTIVYICNPEISGRKVGDTISGYTLSKIMKNDYKEKDFVSNYIIISESNQKVLRASTYYIKHEGELIGLLSSNYDLSKLLEYREFLDKEILYGFENNTVSEREYFDESMDKILDGMIKNVFLYWDRTIPVNKIELEGNPIRQMYKLGIFNYKGAVSRVAQLFGISTQTIYRYLKEFESDNL